MGWLKQRLFDIKAKNNTLDFFHQSQLSLATIVWFVDSDAHVHCDRTAKATITRFSLKVAECITSLDRKLDDKIRWDVKTTTFRH